MPRKKDPEQITSKNKVNKKEDSLFDWVKKSIDLLVHKSLSETVILSSYKLNTILKENYGVNLKIDRIGRALAKYAKQNNLKRLGTNIPKYQLSVKQYKAIQNQKSTEKKD
ncbi:MAG: hypothetical protein ACTSRZ_00625 [Promethearchaeota archaeon]